MPERSPHTPNAVSRGDRLFSLGLAIALIAYGSIGLITARVDLNGRKLRLGVLEGGPAWLMAAAFLVGAAVLLSVVVDHYDKRNNERHYQAFRWGAKYLGCCLAASALLAHLYIGLSK